MPAVLIASSNAKVRMDLRGALHHIGCAIMACESRASSIKALRDRQFDLVVVDAVLNDGPGTEVVRLLKSLGSASSCRVILLASDTAPGGRVQGLDLKPEEILPKPCSTAQVVLRAQRLLHLPAHAPEQPASDPGLRKTPPADDVAVSSSRRPPVSTPDSKKNPALLLAKLEGSPMASAWRDQDAVPPGSLLHEFAIRSGIAGVIGPTTVARACKRAGVDVNANVAWKLEKALPALREALRLFLREPETEDRIQKMAALLRTM